MTEQELNELRTETKKEIRRIYDNFIRDIHGFHPVAKHDAKEVCLGYIDLIDNFKTEDEINSALSTCKSLINSERSLLKMPPEVY